MFRRTMTASDQLNHPAKAVVDFVPHAWSGVRHVWMP
jgi:hypothetical protein